MSGRDAHNQILIIGAPRSGTTLLRRLLNAHPDIACPPETYLFTAAARFLNSEPIADGGHLGVISGLSDSGFEPNDVRQRLREFTFGFLDDYAARQSKSRWVEKTASSVFHLDRIEDLCGDHVTYVCVVRHGLDVACSMKEQADRSEAYLSEIHAYVQRFARPMEAFCHAWVDACQAIRSLAERRPEQVVTLRYEDLVQDPDRELTRVTQFAGTDWDSQWGRTALNRTDDAGLGDWKTYLQTEISSQSTARWKSLTAVTQSELAPILNATLEGWGYPPIRSRGPRSEADAQRRYRLAMRLSALRDQ